MTNPISTNYYGDIPTAPKPKMGIILVTGATGYIGGRLIPVLLDRGYRIRILVRGNAEEYRKRWPQVEVAVGDTLRPESLPKALEGIHTAYYLIHSMLYGPKRFEEADIQSAINFRQAAQKGGLKHIIYLGGLGDTTTKLSRHLRSRLHIAEELSKSMVPVTILRAAIIIGSGSASYEMINHLVNKLPLFLIPSWAKTRCQPISIGDVIKYLVGVLETPESKGKLLDIGGKDILTYKEMLEILTNLLNKKRTFITIPVSNIGIYSYIASLVTPVPADICRCLLEGTSNEVICLDNSIKKLIPIETLSYKNALIGALSREEQDRIATRWSDAYPPAHELAIKLREIKDPLKFSCTYSTLSEKNASDLFRSVCRIGGKEGWFHSNWMWRLRGMIDRILLGVGSLRGRRSNSTLRVEDVIDFWRVEELITDTKLLLRAEMKLPGKAWLEFSISNQNAKNCLTVKAYYQPRGIFGDVYWYCFLPFHNYIFEDLVKGIEHQA